jgi:hypothetical protein
MSVRQIEVSRTLVFAAFRHAHGFFEALVTDYLDIACPEQGKLIFFRHRGGALAHPRCSSHFTTKVITRGVDATVNAFTLPSLGDLDDLGQERHRQPVRLCGEEDRLQRPARCAPPRYVRASGRRGRRSPAPARSPYPVP